MEAKRIKTVFLPLFSAFILPLLASLSRAEPLENAEQINESPLAGEAHTFGNLQSHPIKLVETICVPGLWEKDHVYYAKWWSLKSENAGELMPFLNGTKAPCFATQTDGTFQFKTVIDPHLMTPEQTEASPDHANTVVDKKKIIAEEPIQDDAH